MKEELEKILTNLSDAGCGSEELEKQENSTKPEIWRP